MQYLGYIISVLIAQVVGGMGAFFTTPSIPTWYATLNKPFFNPPNWLFGPVWTLLYALMGISAYMIFLKRKNKDAQNAIVIYAIHLIANFLWSFIFFGARNPGLAFVEIIGLWFLILILIIKFYKIRKIAGLLLIPYILWVSFASLLNFSIWWLN